jgi:hypothetical protein
MMCSIFTSRKCSHYKEFPKSQNTSVDRWSWNKKPPRCGLYQRRISTPRICVRRWHKSVIASWLDSNRVPHQYIECMHSYWLKLTKVTTSYCNGFAQSIARQRIGKHLPTRAQQWKLCLSGRMLQLVARQQSARKWTWWVEITWLLFSVWSVRSPYNEDLL